MIKNKPVVIGLVAVLIVIGSILFGIGVHFAKIGPSDRGNTEPVYITVNSGDHWEEVLTQMDENGLIKNYDAAYNYIVKADPLLYENTYVLNKDQNVKTMVEIISQPNTNMTEEDGYTIVVYEGATLEEIANAYEVNTGGLITAEELMDLWSNERYLKELIDQYWFLTEEILNPDIRYPLEGYFTPATYIIGPTATAESVTEMMLDGTASALAPYEGMTFPNGYTLHEILTLASVIERETITAEDKYLVSGVFYNRIEIGMPLQSDITVLYALGEHKEKVTYEDLEVESPYNTYLHEGLPPGPIASPSITSIDAAINPTESNYFYFYALQDTGEVIYSETYEEHMEVVEANPWE